MNANMRKKLSWAILSTGFLFAAERCGAAERDPFWPIGYSHAKPVSETEVPPKTITPAPPPKPDPPKEKPITESDWTQARKTLAVSGVTRSVNPTTDEVRTLVMVNRKLYCPGDTISLLCGDIRFQWRVVLKSERDVSFDPVKAERVAPPQSPHNKQ